MITIGFTGTRNKVPIKREIALFKLMTSLSMKNKEITFVHGGCTGADQLFHEVAVGIRNLHGKNIKIEVYPGHSKNGNFLHKGRYLNADVIHESKPYFERNRLIVDRSDLMIAIPPLHNAGGGTHYTIDYSLKQNKTLKIL